MRHGQTSHNAEGRYSGREDVPLTERGREQAGAIGRRVAALASPRAESVPPSLAAVLTSPLVRCSDTARAIAAAAGDPPVVSEPDLIELDFGEWEGRTFAEVRQRWPEELGRWQASPDAAPPGGESLAAVATRVRRAVSRLRSAYPQATVAVVSHVWPLKLMLRDALAAGDAFLLRLLLTTGSVSVLDSYPDGTVAVHTVNDSCHLD